MPTVLNNLMQKIDARVVRERLLIMFTLLALVFLLWQLLLQDRLSEQGRVLAQQQAQLASERQQLETTMASLTIAMATDPAIVKRKDIEALKVKVAAVEQQLAGLSQGLISAKLLPQVMHDVLARTQSIELLQVRTLPVVELQLSEASGSVAQSSQLQLAQAQAQAGQGQTQAATAGAGVYKHAVFIRVSASYPQLLQLLIELESLPWKFYWESLDYRVTQYPKAEIDIQVFTLSSEEGLLGV